MSPVDANVIVAILGTGGFAAILTSVVTGLFSRRKLGADATEVITRAAAGVVTNLQAEIDRQSRTNEELALRHERTMHSLITSHTEEMDEVRRVLQLHVAWDAIAIAKMSELGVDLPPAPPLLPPHRQYPSA